MVRWVGRHRATRSVAPEPMSGANRPYVVDEAGAAIIRDVLDCVADTALSELCELYEESRGIRVSSQTMSDTVRRLGYTPKKGSSGGWQPTGRRS